MVLPAIRLLLCACALPVGVLPGLAAGLPPGMPPGMPPGLAVQEWEHAAIDIPPAWPGPSDTLPPYRVGTLGTATEDDAPTPVGPPPPWAFLPVPPVPPAPPPAIVAPRPPAPRHLAAPPALGMVERALPTAIPEPATAALLGGALLALGLFSHAGLRRRFGLSLAQRNQGETPP